jgi:hypothetical protein
VLLGAFILAPRKSMIVDVNSVEDQSVETTSHERGFERDAEPDETTPQINTSAVIPSYTPALPSGNSVESVGEKGATDDPATVPSTFDPSEPKGPDEPALNSAE